MRVFGRERGLAHPAETMDSGDQADGARAERLVDGEEFLPPAHEPGVAAIDIARGGARPATPFNRLPDALIESLQFRIVLPPATVLSGGGAEVEHLPPEQIRCPARRLGSAIEQPWYLAQVDGRRALGDRPASVVACIALPLPAAVGAGNVRGRDERQEHPGFPQGALDSMPPLLHRLDLGRVEEDPEVDGAAPAVPDPQRLDEGGDRSLSTAPSAIVFTAVTHEDVVTGHGWPPRSAETPNDRGPVCSGSIRSCPQAIGNGERGPMTRRRVA